MYSKTEVLGPYGLDKMWFLYQTEVSERQNIAKHNSMDTFLARITKKWNMMSRACYFFPPMTIRPTYFLSKFFYFAIITATILR